MWNISLIGMFRYSSSLSLFLSLSVILSTFLRFNGKADNTVIISSATVSKAKLRRN